MEGIAHIYVINFQASLFPLTFAPAPQQGQLKVATSYMNVTSHSVTSLLTYPLILKKADKRRLHRPSSTFSQKRREPCSKDKTKTIIISVNPPRL